MNDTIKGRRIREYVQVHKDFLYSVGLLTPSEKLIMILLWSYGDNVFPAVKTLARYAGMSERTVRYTINSLCEKGVLRKHSRVYDNGEHTSNEYEPLDEPILWASDNEDEMRKAAYMTQEERYKKYLESQGYTVSKSTNEPQTAPQTPSKPEKHKPTGKRKTAPKATTVPTDGVPAGGDYATALAGLRLITEG